LPVKYVGVPIAPIAAEVRKPIAASVKEAAGKFILACRAMPSSFVWLKRVYSIETAT
jgi:hypothetical protein